VLSKRTGRESARGADVEAKASLAADVLETYEPELTMDPPHFEVLRWGRLPRFRSLRDLGTGGLRSFQQTSPLIARRMRAAKLAVKRDAVA
jgi:hypothetical protein